MSARMHTPGPWHWESDPVKGDPTGRVRYRVTTTGKTITQVYYSSFEGGPTNAEADARLIASAPDLLTALEASLLVIKDYLEYEHNGDPWTEDARAMGEMEIDDYEHDGRLEAARSAIAKARGTA